jgi:hypothetical protein
LIGKGLGFQEIPIVANSERFVCSCNALQIICQQKSAGDSDSGYYLAKAMELSFL